jgi:hypothetical protein
VSPQGLVSRCELARQRPELIPQRLRRHLETRPLHRLHLAVERDTHRVAVERDLDREVEAVPTARDQLLGAGRALDVAADAVVLLTTVLLDDVLELDDIDLLTVVELIIPGLELSGAARADPIGLVEHMDLGLEVELRLRRRAVAALLALGLGRLLLATWASLAAATGLAEALAAFELGAELLALRALGQPRDRLLELAEEPANLGVLELGDLPEQLDIGGAVEVDRQGEMIIASRSWKLRLFRARCARG